MPVLRKRMEAGNDAGAMGLEERGFEPDNRLVDRSGQQRGTSPNSLLPICGNERCRTSWLRLWRRRQTPRFAGFWACSPVCLEEMVRVALMREAQESMEPGVTGHRHRVPLGLMLYSRGVISREQLRRALDAQREAEAGAGPRRRIGRWLIEQSSLNELELARALSLQWNCPLYSAERLDAARAAQLMPRLLVDACGATPLRRTGSGRILVAFEDALDHCLSLALERMHGAPVEAGVMAANDFRRVKETLEEAKYPKLRLIEVANRNVLARALTRRIEQFQPLDATLVRVREYYWLRMWKTLDRDADGMEDLLAVEASFGG
jgi:hypothetical protein